METFTPPQPAGQAPSPAGQTGAPAGQTGISAGQTGALTGQPGAPAGKRHRITFGQVALTIVHLAALGLIGSIAFSIAGSLLAAGIATLFAFGVGIFVLVGMVYVLYAFAWCEVERVQGLYGFNIPSLRLRRSTRPGFAGWLKGLARQSIDGRMWLALLSLGFGTLLGAIVLRLANRVIWYAIVAGGGAETSFSFLHILGIPDAGWSLSPIFAAFLAIFSLAAIIGLAALHAVTARAILGSPSRSDLAEEVRTRSAQREGAVRAADVERTRIERDLHDGVQPRLVSIGMTLGLAQQKLEEDPQTARALIEEAHASTKSAITELRQLARGIHTSVLDDRGLDAALSALAARSPIPVELDVRMEGRDAAITSSTSVFRDAEAAVYFSIAEALTNAAKHSRAAGSRVTVRLREVGTPQEALWARIEDNGIGGAIMQPGGGLDGISNRVLAARGTFRFDSPQGGPTTLEVSVPCAS